MSNRFHLIDIKGDCIVEEIALAEAGNMGVSLFIKREDRLHPTVSGNKLRKLKYNLHQAQNENKKTLLTFGGAYSNHIAAVAEAGSRFGFKTIGVIRGEKPNSFNPTLLNAQSKGMQLIFVSRSSYKNKDLILSDLKIDFSKVYVIPEGGTNLLALKGCQEIVQDERLEQKIDYWCVASGTGGTAAGMITGLKNNQQLIAFPVLKGGFMKDNISALLKRAEVQKNNWSVEENYYFGGYAKFDDRLIDFINDFNETHNIPLDPIYTGKMVYGVFDLIKKGFFPAGSTVMMVHTGGLQGIAGFNERFGNIIKTKSIQ